MKVIGYVRVSTEKQASEGVSLDAQKSKIEQWCELHDYALHAIYEDAGISGRDDTREGLAMAIQALKKGDVLVVYSLSRLSRSTKHTLEVSALLDKKGCDLVSISDKLDTTSAAGKMIFRLIAVLNEFEADQVSERTKAALAYKKQRGERVGEVQYGYSVDGDGKTLVPNAIEQEVIAIVKQLYAGGMTCNAITRELKKLGFSSRAGTDFHCIQIQRMLKNGTSR